MVDLKKRFSPNVSGLILIIITAFVVAGVVWAFKNSQEFQTFTSYITGKIGQQEKTLRFLPKNSFLTLQISDVAGSDILEKSLDNKLAIFDIEFSELKEAFASNNKKDLAISLSEQDGKAEMIIAAKIFNQQKYNEIKKKLQDSGKMTDSEIGGFFYAEKTNCIILATNKELLETSLKQNFSEDITSNTKWQEAQRTLSKSAEVKIILIPTTLTEKAVYLDYIALEALKDQDEYLIKGKIAGNEELMKKAQIKFDQKDSKEFALYKDISKDNALFLFESFDLEEEIRTAENVAKIENESWYNDLQNKKKDWKDAASIDFENDITSWMNDNYLIALHKSVDNQLPDFSFIFDVKSTAKKARSFFSDTNDLAKFWANIAPQFTGKSINRNIADNLFAFDFEDIFPEFRKAFSLVYGVTDQDIVIFSTIPNADKEISREAHFIKIPENLQEGHNLMLLFPNKINDKITIENLILRSLAEEYNMGIEGVLEFNKS